MSPTALLFLAAFAAGCFYSLKRHPIYGLMTYVGVFYVEPGAQWWGQGFIGSIRWVFVAAGLTLVSMLIHRKKLSPVRLSRNGAIVGFVVFVVWMIVQSPLALDKESHQVLISTWVKFLITAVMIIRCIDTEKHLRLFLWAHVCGCAYLGFIALISYTGGRFEGFGASGLAEANAGALQLVTGVVVGGALFLEGRLLEKGALVVLLALIANGIVTTVSRSGFLSMSAAALVFNIMVLKKYRTKVRVLTVVAAFMAVALTNPQYWERIATIKYTGADVEGVDTGGGRLEIMQAQVLMFKSHLLGCGHMCTTELSPQYIEARFLTIEGGRASHNTFMTMLVDHGVPGGIMYVALLMWIAKSILKLRRRLRNEEGLLATLLPAVAAVLGAITVADLFVQYPKLEARVWFISVVIVMLHLTADRDAPPRRPGPPSPGPVVSP